MTDQGHDQSGAPDESGLLKTFETLLAAALAPDMSSGMAVFERELIIGALIRHRDSGTPLPSGVVDDLLDALNALQKGHKIPLLNPPPKEGKGTPGRHPVETACIDIAVMYYLGVEARDLEDPHPIKTIDRAFGSAANRRTIQTWMSNNRNRMTPLPSLSPNIANLLLSIAGRAYARNFGRAARAKRGEFK